MRVGEAPDADADDAAGRIVELGGLLLDADLPVTDVGRHLESVRAAVPCAGPLRCNVLPTTVLISHERDSGSVWMGSATGGGLSMDQAADAMRLVRAVAEDPASLQSAPGRVERIRAAAMRHPQSRWVAGTSLIAFGLAVVFRCPWWAVLVAGVVGLLVGSLTALLKRSAPASAIVPFVAAFVSTLAVGGVAAGWSMGDVPLFAVCAPIAILVPGATITNALLELTATDIVSGSARLMYGIIVLGFMVAGIAAGAALTGLHIDGGSAALIGNTPGLTGPGGGWRAIPPIPVAWVGVFLVGIGVAAAFGARLLFGAVCAVAMLCTYGLLVSLTPPCGAVAATGVTAAVLFVVARVGERVSATVPSAVSFQPAFLLLVPGTVGLVAFTALDQASVSTAVLTFISLCIGVKAGSVVADTPWRALLGGDGESKTIPDPITTPTEKRRA